ncbi:antibiotic biosynthesis monooxygenase family protein [Streptomyces sp. KN37]|uniref:antibiotic biosynthesis monooxygenase family protein n=1 Tax=Streptomyces sp. KN37 TaxID=3090667 RepID=UPI0039BDCE97
MESAGTPGGLGITVGYFRDEEAIKAWQSDPEHRVAQRSHGFVRGVTEEKAARSFSGNSQVDARVLSGARPTLWV